VSYNIFCYKEIVGPVLSLLSPLARSHLHAGTGGPLLPLNRADDGPFVWLADDLGGVRLEELKFNQYCSTFVLFDKKFSILD
jgi:hypothetical protein